MQMIKKITLLALVASSVATEFKFIACGKGARDGTCNDGILKVQSVDQPNELRCCSDEQKSGWVKYNDANHECTNWAQSQNLADPPMGETIRVGQSDHHGCVRAATYAEAEQICASHGAYVCTKEQVLGGCSRSKCFQSSSNEANVWKGRSHFLLQILDARTTEN